LRKLTAIGLWGLILFNWIGYRALHEYLQDRATRQLEAKLDKNQYRDDQLLHLKVPTAHLSYFTQQADFDRINGEIDIDGVPYQYVARRIVNDSAEYLCIPNQQALSLKNDRDKFYSLVNDLGSQQKDQKSQETNFFGDPYELPKEYAFDAMTTIPVQHRSLVILHLPAGTQSLADRPPGNNA
jgi:hypothetical protein